MKGKKSKIKVCHFTSVHSAKDDRIFYKECCSLAKAGYDVILVVAGAADEICNGVSIVGVPVKKNGRLHRVVNVGKDVYEKALKTDADIYHFHDPELLLWGLKLKSKGKTVIFDSHEFVGYQILTKNYLPKILRKAVASIYRMIEIMICNRLDAVIEVCTVKGEDYFKKVKKRKIFIRNVQIINDNKTTDLEVDVSKSCLVAHVGGLTEERGITNLAKAIILTKAKLSLAGTFSSKEYEQKIRDIAGEQLDYRGQLPFGSVDSFLGECKIGTSTLLDVGQYGWIDTPPSKIFDYMRAGIPVIMSDFKFLKEFNKKYQIGICIDSNSPKEIADGINYLLDHPDEARQMGENGRKAVLEEFNWSIEEMKLLTLYDELKNTKSITTNEDNRFS